MTEHQIDNLLNAETLEIPNVLNAIAQIAKLLTPSETRNNIREQKLDEKRWMLARRIYKQTKREFKKGGLDAGEKKILKGIWLKITQRALDLNLE